MELFLLRHGRTKANEDHLYCGSTDWYLSPAGIEELRALASTRPLPRFDVAADTGMHRTRETADILCRAARRVTLPSLREMDFGLFERKSYETLRFDPYYIKWITDESGECTCPWGESRNTFYTRVCDGFKAFAAETDAGSACIVCHGGTICAILDSFCTEKRGFYEWQPAFGHGWRLELTVSDTLPQLTLLERI